MHVFVTYVVLGILAGSVYGLLAIPYNLVFSTTRALDVAVGGYAAVAGLCVNAYGVTRGLLVAIVIDVALGAVMGLVYLVMQARGATDPIRAVLASFGMLFAVQSALAIHFSANPVHVAKLQRTWQVWDVPIQAAQLVTLLIACAILALVAIVIARTSLGRMMRASAASAEFASLSGINVKLLQCGAFAVGGLLAAIAGAMTVMTNGISSDDALTLTLNAFGAFILLGGATPTRAFVGGILLGIVGALSSGYFTSELSAAVPLVFILVVLALGRVRLNEGLVEGA